MRKITVVLATLLALFVSGCGGPGKPRTPLPNHTFSGEPTDVVVKVTRPGAKGVTPNSLTTLQDDGEETRKLTVTIYKDNIYRVHREIDVTPGFQTTSVQMTVPSDQGYSVAAILVENGTLLEVGREANISAPDDIETIVSLAIAPPQYTLKKPDKMYSGGNLGQFWVELPNHLRHILYESYIYFGLSEWTSLTEFFALYDAEPRQGWLWGLSTFLPEFTEPTPLYYQISICAQPGYFGDDQPCFFFPPMGERLPSIMVYPSPD